MVQVSYEERILKLQGLGLSEYQARVYHALLELGTATAGQIPSLSRVPRTRIYVTMAQLHEKGLVHILPETPIKYQAVPVADFLRSRCVELRERAKHLEENAGEIASAFDDIQKRAPEVHSQFEVIYGRKNIRDRLEKMYGSAVKTIMAVGTARSPVRIVHTTLSLLAERRAAGVRVIFAVPVNDQNRPQVERMGRELEVVHIERDPPLHLAVVDDSETMLIHRIPDDDNPHKGNDVAIWTNDRAVVASMGEVTNRYFSASIRPEAANYGLESVASLGEWLKTLHMDPGPHLAVLGKTLGEAIASGLKGRGTPGVLKEMTAFWEREHLGSVAMAGDPPKRITVDSPGFCQCAGTETARTHGYLCVFVHELWKGMLSAGLGRSVGVKGTACRVDEKGKCVLRVELSA